MRTLLIAVLALSATACASLDAGVVKVTASDRFSDICRLAPAAHTTFVVLAANVTVSPTVLNAERAAYAVIRSTCANPPQDTVDAVATLAEAYGEVLKLQTVLVERQS